MDPIEGQEPEPQEPVGQEQVQQPQAVEIDYDRIINGVAAQLKPQQQIPALNPDDAVYNPEAYTQALEARVMAKVEAKYAQQQAMASLTQGLSQGAIDALADPDIAEMIATSDLTNAKVLKTIRNAAKGIASDKGGNEPAPRVQGQVGTTSTPLDLDTRGAIEDWNEAVYRNFPKMKEKGYDVTKAVKAAGGLN